MRSDQGRVIPTFELESEDFYSPQEEQDIQDQDFINQELEQVQVDTKNIIEELEQLVVTVEGEHDINRKNNNALSVTQS